MLGHEIFNALTWWENIKMGSSKSLYLGYEMSSAVDRSARLCRSISFQKATSGKVEIPLLQGYRVTWKWNENQNRVKRNINISLNDAKSTIDIICIIIFIGSMETSVTLINNARCKWRPEHPLMNCWTWVVSLRGQCFLFPLIQSGR